MGTSADFAFAGALAGFLYGVTPGPAFLAVFALTARQGRAAGGRFLCGHLAGDLLWGGLAIAAIVGVNELGPRLFDALGIGCSLYLIFLGLRAIRAPADRPAAVIGAAKPIRVGLIFGLTNPKAYPVALAIFTALTLRYAAEIGWDTTPLLLAASVSGLLIGYGVILFCAGLPPVRRFFLTHGRVVTRIVGVSFVLFGLKSLTDAGRSLTARG